MNKNLFQRYLQKKHVWITSIIIVFFCLSCKKKLTEPSTNPQTPNNLGNTLSLNGKWKIMSTKMVEYDQAGKVLLKDSTSSSSFMNFNHTHLSVNNNNLEYTLFSEKNKKFFKYKIEDKLFLFEVIKLTTDIMILDKKESLPGRNIKLTLILNRSK